MWRVGIAFLLGHCCIHSLAQLPPLRPATLAFAGIAALVSSRSAILAAFAAGFAWAWINAAVLVADDLPTALEGRDVLVRGYVASFPRGSVDPQFLFDVSTAQPGVPSRLRLTWFRAARPPQAGEPWQLLVRLKRRNGLANPGGFDFEAHLLREGVGASGYVREAGDNRRLGPPSLRYAIERMRAWIAMRIEQALGKRKLLGVVQGLAVGDTQQMTADQWRVFAATGTTHLMAISGLHIGMIAALASWLGGAVVRLRGAQSRGVSAMHGQVIAGACAATAYSLLAGLSVPTQRTLVMLCIFFAVRWARRELPSGHALGLSLVAILLVDPFAPLAAGAWLSFGAVAIILLAVCGRLQRDGIVRNFLRVQVAVTIGLAPVLIAAFGSLSLIAPLANMLAAPLFTLIVVPTVLLGTLVAVVYLPAGAWMLAAPAAILDWTWPALTGLADLPISLWHVPQGSVPALLALAAGVLLLVLPGIWPTRLTGALLCLPVMLNRPAALPSGDFELSLLDVGQGLAAVVRTRSHVLLYDTGPAFQGRNAADLAVLPYLRHRGVRRIDALVVSHGDLDHAGGMRTVLATLPVARILLGPSVAERPDAAQSCSRGQQWNWDGVTFEMLHPARLGTQSENDSSCVLRIRAAAGTALLTGDIEAQAEAQLLESGLGHADVVVVPHHGSRSVLHSCTGEHACALHGAGVGRLPQPLESAAAGGGATLA